MKVRNHIKLTINQSDQFSYYYILLDKEVRTETADYNGIQCHVCNDAASGLHFGAFTCEGCKGFFRRMMNEQKVPRCDNDGKCDITNKNRNSCRACRFKKCLEVGMDLKSKKSYSI